jgi:aminoglycoside 3-N-acetyltransferase
MEQWEKERLVVERTEKPITRSTLVHDLRNIGLHPGNVAIVHSSMSRIGWTVGGPVAVIEALMETLTEEGVLAMPALSTDNTEPSAWQRPAVPETWWPVIRKEMPPYRPRITPTRGLGRIAEAFRSFPGAHRSNHPQHSFAAWGKNAESVIKEHPLDRAFGQNSPLGRLYELEAKILLIGVGHESNTSLHHAEHIAELPAMPRKKQGAAILENGVRVWKSWEEMKYDSEDFPLIGAAYEESIEYRPQRIGQAESRLLSMRGVVDFGVKWLRTNRSYD